jgi:hypothetical protein
MATSHEHLHGITYKICMALPKMKKGESLIIEATPQKAWHYANLHKVRISTSTVYLVEGFPDDPVMKRAVRVTVI